ncbi:MAG: hypothetical protein R2827_01615 [Bdellovibrionales bacterium]
MIVKLRHKESREDYILIGSGFGMADSSASPTVGLFGEPGSSIKDSAMLCVVSRHSEIKWIPADDLDVVTIDNKSVTELF